MELKFTCSSFSFWQRRRDIIISIETCHFFCDICGAENVMTEGRCNNFIALFVIGKFYICKIIQHLFAGQIGSKQCIDAFRLKFHANWLFAFGVYICHATDYFTGTQFFDQLACTIDRCLCIVRIQTFFELAGSIGSKTDFLCRKADVGAIKTCSLKHHRLYIVSDHGILTAHDAGNANSFLTVTDHQNRIIHRTFLTVQCGKFFAVFGSADHDLMTCKGIIIIGMHRLAVFFHYIVCDIDNVVDRTDSV